MEWEIDFYSLIFSSKQKRSFAATNLVCSTQRMASSLSKRSSGTPRVRRCFFFLLFLFFLFLISFLLLHISEGHSKAYKEFLNFIGEHIELKNWKGYRAGLDVNGIFFKIVSFFSFPAQPPPRKMLNREPHWLSLCVHQVAGL